MKSEFIVSMLIPEIFFYIKLKRSFVRYMYVDAHFFYDGTEDVQKLKWDFDEHHGVAHRASRRANKTIFKGGKRFPSHQLTSLSRILEPGL